MRIRRRRVDVGTRVMHGERAAVHDVRPEVVRAARRRGDRDDESQRDRAHRQTRPRLEPRIGHDQAPGRGGYDREDSALQAGDARHRDQRTLGHHGYGERGPDRRPTHARRAFCVGSSRRDRANHRGERTRTSDEPLTFGERPRWET